MGGSDGFTMEKPILQARSIMSGDAPAALPRCLTMASDMKRKKQKDQSYMLFHRLLL